MVKPKNAKPKAKTVDTKAALKEELEKAKSDLLQLQRAYGDLSDENDDDDDTGLKGGKFKNNTN